MTIKTLSLSIAATSLAAFAAPSAFATGWVPTDGQDADAPRVIYTETDTGAALLGCTAEGKMMASLSNSGENFAGRLKRNAPYRRGVDVELTIGDKTNENVMWSLIPAKGMIFSSSPGQAAKLFNATIRGDVVTVTVDGKAYTSMTLPAIDDTFKAFAKTCT